MSTPRARTWDGIDPRRTGRAGARVRRVGMGLLAAVVVAGAWGAWGVRTATATATTDCLRLEVDSPAWPGRASTSRSP